MVDADNFSFTERKSQIDQSCDDSKVPRRTKEDPVVVAVPERTIETWFVYLTGETWSPKADYTHRQKDDLAKNAAKALHEMCYVKQKLTVPAPDSLQDACDEWQRI